MNPFRYRVGIRRGGDPALMVLNLLREIVTKEFRGQSVLIKPNLGFLGRPGTGIVTHCEVVRGVVRFMKEAGARDRVFSPPNPSRKKSPMGLLTRGEGSRST